MIKIHKTIIVLIITRSYIIHPLVKTTNVVGISNDTPMEDDIITRA